MSFVWPIDGNFANIVPSGTTVNMFDTLEIDYSSTWSALNFTLFCQIGDVSTDYGVWQAPSNPMAASGTYRLTSIYTAGFDIVKFPTECAFRITEYGDADTYNAGQFFQVVSQPGTSTTYESTSTATAASSSSASQSSGTPASATSTSGTTASASSGSSSSASASSTSTSSSSSSPATTITPVAQQSVLSTGAKAGIGVGVAAVVLIIAALCFVVFRLRRRHRKLAAAPEGGINRHEEVPAYTKAEAQYTKPGYTMQEMEQTSRVELPNQQQSFRPPELE